MKRFIYCAGVLGLMQVATHRDHDQAGQRMSHDCRPADPERDLPPVTELAMASLALIVIGGIYLSAHLPEHVSLVPPAILLACSAACSRSTSGCWRG